MGREATMTDKIARPVGPFSAAVRMGDALFLSGQVGQRADSGKLVEGGLAAEAEQILDNCAAVLCASGRTFADVVRVGVYLTDMRDFAALNEIYARRFSPPYPARTVVAVAALPLGARVEIDLVAGAPAGSSTA